MVRLKRIRYWLLGVLTAVLWVAASPAMAYLSGSPTVSPPFAAIVQTSASLEQQAQTAYQLGQYQEAVTLLLQASEYHQLQGNLAQEAIALSNLSLAYQHLGDWSAAEAAINQAQQIVEQQAVSLGVQAQMLDVQGQLYFAQGKVDNALDAWKQSDDIYTQINNLERQAFSRLYQAQALQAKGLYHQVFQTLEDLAEDVRTQPDSPMQASILRQLGDNLRATGKLDLAEEQLQESLQIAERLQHQPLTAAANLSLGNLEQSKFKVAFEDQQLSNAIAHAEKALSYYKQVAQLDENELGIQARLNFMRLITSPILARWDLAMAFYPTIKELLPQLPPGRSTVLAYVGLVDNLITLRDNNPNPQPSWRDIAALLAPAQEQAEALGDPRSQSLVLGTLGHIYEKNQQWADAKILSRQALTLAQQAQADDIRYRWEWQLGRILNAEGDKEGALAAYTRSHNTITALRSDLITANPDVQFSFRDSVEPVYRGLVELLVAPVPQLQNTAQIKTNSSNDDDEEKNPLQKASEVMHSLQMAELQNFFQADCIEKPVNLDEVILEEDEKTAVVYAISLRDRLEVILKIPELNFPKKETTSPNNKKMLVHFSTCFSNNCEQGEQSNEIARELKSYRNNLTTGADVISNGQQLYNWLLKPAVDRGLLTGIETLIFVLDGDLRLIPMATLHDGEDFLVKKYAISLVLGSEIRDPQVLPPRNQIQILAASLATPPAAEDLSNSPEEIPNFGDLPGVTEEVAKIKATGMPVTTLQDKAFTSNALEQELIKTDYSIVHLATHGEFGRGRQNTYILAADKFIYVDDLGQIFQSRRRADTNLEMLILSACNTATGDSREVLGIAGAMVQSGARSAIATLWSVDDQASVLFAENFYGELGKPGVSRAEALRRAQVALLERYPDRPRYWAPYVLVGSWR